MKKKLLLALSALLSTSLLVGCDTKKNSTSNDGNSQDSFNSQSLNEKNKNVPNEKKVYPTKVDYTSQLTFNENSGRKYRKISGVKALIDGDTSHFYLDDVSDFPDKNEIHKDKILKVRYLGVDTPESTGQVEEWGKAASNFNKSRLSNAESIIVESNDGQWNTDSTSVRFLCFVWYRETATSPYRNLNLELLQEGFSYAKTISSINEDYRDIFQKAFSQANSLEYHIFAKQASNYTFDANMNLIESNGYVLGTYGPTDSFIAVPRDKMSEVSTLRLYEEGKDGPKVSSAAKVGEGLNKDVLPDFYLGTEINGTTYFYTGNVTDGLGTLSTSFADAVKVKVDRDYTVSKVCYNIYTLDTNKVNHYITLNTVNNLDYMYRDSLFYYGDVQISSIKALRTHPEIYAGGVAVRVEGVVTKIAGTTFYIQEEDEETGLTYAMAVFMGYSFGGQSLIKVGNRLSVCGKFSNGDFGPQISDLNYFKMKPNHTKNTKVLAENQEFNVREITGAELLDSEKKEIYDGISRQEILLDTMVTMSNLTVTDVYTTKKGTSEGAMTLTCTDVNGTTVSVRTKVLYDENGKIVEEDAFINKTIDVKGLVDNYETTYQVLVFTMGDITIK